MTDKKLKERGLQMCQLASTSDDFAGSVICVELAQEAQSWLLGVVEPSGMYTVEVGFTSYILFVCLFIRHYFFGVQNEKFRLNVQLKPN